MNGLLHRLAARANGTAVSVRSGARLPYGGGTPGWVDAPQPEFAATPDAVLPGEQASPPGGLRPGSIERGPRSPGVHTPASIGAPPGGTPPGPVPLGSASRVALEPTEEPAPAIATPPEQAPLVRAEIRSVPAAASLPATPSEPPTERQGGPSEPPVRHRSSPRMQPLPFEGDADAVPRVGRVAAYPTPLMPPTADRATPGRNFVPPLGSAMRATSQPDGGIADDATEVHIHIGRIDVTAVHEAPPPRRKQPATPAPTSLDAYLARRGC